MTASVSTRVLLLKSPLTSWAGPYMSQTTENRKVETRKPLIFRDPIFGFYLQNPALRQSQHFRPLCVSIAGTSGTGVGGWPCATVCCCVRRNTVYTTHT